MYYLINNFVLVLLLILSMHYDVKERKIPNILTFPVILWAFLSSIFFNGVSGVIFSTTGFLVGMTVFFIPFAAGGMGAGDVKLMGAIGSLMGWAFVLKSALFTGVVGGIIAVGYSIYSGVFFSMLKSTVGIIMRPLTRIIYYSTGNTTILKINSYFEKIDHESEKKYIPYGLAIGIGTIMVLSGKFNGIFPV